MPRALRFRLSSLPSLGLIIALAFVGCTDGSSPGEPGSTASEATAAPAAGSYVIEHEREGAGSSPTATDVVRVHYHGTFPDGRVFDSSVDRGSPARFPLNRVIPCWTQALQEMKVGGKALITCPPDLAYGPNGKPPTIPPSATLVFDVELLEVE